MGLRTPDRRRPPPGTPRRRRWAPAAVAVAGLAGWAGALAARPQEPPPGHVVEEELVVREVPIVVELPSNLGRPDRRDFMVREGERLWEVRAFTRLDEDRWQVLVYLDTRLVDPETSFLGLLALAQRARELVGLGPVTVIVAEAEPRVIVESTEEEQLLLERLAALAGKRPGRHGVESLRREFAALAPEDRTAEVAERYRRRETATVEARLGILSEVAAERCPAPPCALLLVCSGYYLEPEEYYLAGSQLGVKPAEGPVGAAGTEETGMTPVAGTGRPASELARATEALAAELAAGGWTVLGIPFRRIAEPGPPARRWTDFDEWSSLTTPPLEGGTPLFGTRRPHREESLPMETLDYLILPRYAPLRRLAQSSAGSLVRAEEELSGLLDRLASRWVLWYQRSNGPEPVPAQRLEVLDLRRGGRVRAPAWAPAWEGVPAG
jgi:hypothetical protein